jgi:hypothetical protein
MNAHSNTYNPGRLGLIAVVAGLALAALAPAAAQAATPVSVSVGPDGKVNVVGDSTVNQLTFSDQTDPACPGGSPCYAVRSFANPLVVSAPCVDAAPAAVPGMALCPAAGVTGVTMIGREGDDSLLLSEFAFVPEVPASLSGGGGDDELQGSGFRDQLSGGIDDDTIRGGGGNDVIGGNPGADRLLGAKGADRVTGGPGKDDVIGGLGNDALFGSAGNDGLDGAGGRDLCNGGGGRDKALRCEKDRRIP